MIENIADQEKFEAIYTKYREMMYHVAFEVLGDESEAEDAVHLAFVHIAENIGKLDAVDSPRTKKFLSLLSKDKAFGLLRDKSVRQES